jgi:hypothetical protein
VLERYVPGYQARGRGRARRIEPHQASAGRPVTERRHVRRGRIPGLFGMKDLPNGHGACRCPGQGVSG